MGTKDPLTSMRTVYLGAGIVVATAACVACGVMARRAAGPSRGADDILDEGTLAQNLWAWASGAAAVILLILGSEAVRRWKMER